MALRDKAANALSRVDVSKRGLSPAEGCTRAGGHATSDCPLILSTMALNTDRAAVPPLKRPCRQRTLPNFKAPPSVRLGEMSGLE